jgi:hypothetical protein
MPPMPWIKIYTEMLDDVKILDLEDAVAWRFVQLIMMAGECDAAGALITGDKPMTTRQIARRLRLDTATLEADIAAMVEAGLLMWADKTLVVKKFSDRQGPTQAEKRQQWNARQQRKRERVKGESAEPPAEQSPTPNDEQSPDQPSTDHAGVTRDSRVNHALEEEEEEEGEEEVRDNPALKAGALAPYADIWTNETKLPQFFPNQVSFIEDLKKVVATGVTPEDWRAGIQALMRKKYNITRPISCLNAAIIAMSERARGSPQDQRAVAIEELYPTFRAGDSR